MDEFNYAALAPRQGSRPMLSQWSSIGTHEMHGGAFNLGSLWSGLRNVGSAVKNWGSRAWHSNAGKALRAQLKKTGLQEKIIEGVSAGIHGAVDLGRQQLEKAIEQRLERRPAALGVEDLPPPPGTVLDAADLPPSYAEAMAERPAPAEVLVPATVPAASTTAAAASAPVAISKPPLAVVELPPKKRLPEEDDLVIQSSAPPSYEEVMATPTPLVAEQGVLKAVPVTRPAQPFSPAVHETQRIVTNLPISTAVTRQRGWQGTLNDIVGLGVRTVKRRRCY
ncbi:pVI [Deer mastadenovirus B]|uniref:PVI n=1 Tax=Deer mastadenovirus B TaxID=2170000 RepID=A0A1Y0B6H3_9ADEN|nr:pVI [Deer mastadenovirus B]ART33371.1 pVI [Deer mastadenovirus B]